MLQKEERRNDSTYLQDKVFPQKTLRLPGEFHEQVDTKSIVMRGLEWGYNNMPWSISGRSISCLRFGCPLQCILCF
jgi:hypothetical protein